jgi:hypothetical protein
MFCLLLAQVQTMAATPLPKDVATFVERREGCDHFRGEEPTSADPHRAREINRELKKLCTGTDKKLSRLKQKYAANAEITALLAPFEPNIEPGRLPHRH